MAGWNGAPVLSADRLLTQFGTIRLRDPVVPKTPFRCTPNLVSPRRLSLLYGGLDPDEAARLNNLPPGLGNIRVRYTSVGLLLSAGFALTWDDARGPGLGHPVLVTWPSSDWTHAVSLAFHQCFTAAIAPADEPADDGWEWDHAHRERAHDLASEMVRRHRVT